MNQQLPSETHSDFKSEHMNTFQDVLPSVNEDAEPSYRNDTHSSTRPMTNQIPTNQPSVVMSPFETTHHHNHQDTQDNLENHAKQTCCQLIKKWTIESVWPGMGLFGESYILFSIGTLMPIWQVLYPNCFIYQETCSSKLLYSLTYSVVLGIITGMIILGYIANQIGRRNGSIITATIMSVGSLGMIVISFLWSSQESVTILFQGMVICLFFFGVGVGGEYPLSASLASEKAMQQLHNQRHIIEQRLTAAGQTSSAGDDKVSPLVTQNNPQIPQQRGRQIQLVFTMQGMGIWFNSVTLMILLLATTQTSSDNYQHDILLSIWRITYGIGAAILIVVLLTRCFYLEESTVWAQDKLEREHKEQGIVNIDENLELNTDDISAIAQNNMANVHPSSQLEDTTSEVRPPDILTSTSTISELSFPTVVAGQDDNEPIPPQSSSLSTLDQTKASHITLLLHNYGGRLFGASMSWLLWDISFYGNKLFQSSFILALTGENTTLLEFAMAATLNSTIALLGYFGAAMLVDQPAIGRVRLQVIGFLITGLLFVTCGFFVESLSTGVSVALYLASSFIGQLGPNATTFLIPAEIFPTEQRTYCHGICAAAGKMGALVAAILFHFVSQGDLFLLSGYASIVACFVTYYFIPETTGVDLLETDIQWRLILEGRKHKYSGPMNRSEYLSPYERWKRASAGSGGQNLSSAWNQYNID